MRAKFVQILLLLATVGLHAEQDLIVDIGNTGEPGTLDPHLYFTNLEEHILKDLFVGLTTMDASGEIIPGCAESWTVSDDQLTWTFHLRERLRWSDGEPLTASDFVFGFQRLLNPETAASLSFFLYSIDGAREVNSASGATESLGVSALDDTTLVIQLKEPSPFFAERLLYPVAYPVPAHVVNQHGDNWIKAENWVSNGPFVLNEWRPHEYVEVGKNPLFYAADQVAIDTVRYYPTTEPMTAYNRYLTGELDYISNYPRGVHASLLESRENEVHLAPLQSIMYLVFNTQKKPFDDIRVRKALALAIDRNLIVDRLLGLGEVASSTLSPPIVDNHVPVEYEHEQNVALAKQLLKDAGYTERPLQLELRHLPDEETRNIYVVIASMWKDVGVETTLHHSPLADHFGNLNQGNFDVAQAGWFGENNPEHYIELLSSKISAANYGKYESAKFDELLAQAKAQGNIAERVDLLHQAETLALKEYPVIPLYVVSTRNLVNPKLKGWLPNGRNLHPARYFYWE